MTDTNKAEETSVESDAGPLGWWKIVTPSMLRQAPDVIASFIEGKGAALPFDIEGFARALSLQQLFEGGDEVGDVASRAYNLMPPDPKDVAGGLVAAEAWLPRGAAIKAGLLRSLELLFPRVDVRWARSVDRFKYGISLLESSCVHARTHAGTREPIVVKKYPNRWRKV